MRAWIDIEPDVDPREPAPQSTVEKPRRGEVVPYNKRQAAYPANPLPDLDENGQWIEDPREKEEPWRAKFKLQYCSFAGGCQVKVRGGDRCPDHPRKCAGISRKGTPCEAPPLRGLEFCFGHCSDEEWTARCLEVGQYEPLDPDVDPTTVNGRLAVDADGNQVVVPHKMGSPAYAAENGALGSAARRYPRLHERLQQEIEAQAEEIVGAGIRALRATKPVLVERSGRDENGDRYTEQEVIQVDDELVQLKAHEALTNRAFGKPHTSMDISQETRQLNLVLDARDVDTRNELHDFLRRRPRVDG